MLYKIDSKHTPLQQNFVPTRLLVY